MSNGQGRISDKERILKALVGGGAGQVLSSAYLKGELNLSNDRYAQLRDELINEGLVEKYRCRGGGLRLTEKGEKSAPKISEYPSAVNKEDDLYDPVCKTLEQSLSGDELTGIVINTGRLKKKGKWQNPDVVQITYDHYRYLRKDEIVIVSMEIKKWGGWNTSVAFEAASHRRFVHKAIVVLEWNDNVAFSLSDTTYKMDEIARECQRFGVGLSTLHKKGDDEWSLRSHIDPQLHDPNVADVEEWLEYIFSRDKRAEKAFLAMNSCFQSKNINSNKGN